MNPQGSTLFNAGAITQMTDRVNRVQTCAGLQALTTEVMADVSAIKAAINAEIAQLAPILALLTAPGADLSKLATWVGSFITNVLAPQYQPYINYATELAELTSAVAGLAAAIEAKAASIGECSVTIPTF